MAHSQLVPRYPTEDEATALQGQKAKQQHYYNRSAKNLPPISAGETVRMRLPGQGIWTPWVCTGPRGPRSYGVRVGNQEFRRNRRQLLLTREPLPSEHPAKEPGPGMPTPPKVEAREDSELPPTDLQDTPIPIDVEPPDMLQLIYQSHLWRPKLLVR